MPSRAARCGDPSVNGSRKWAGTSVDLQFATRTCRSIQPCESTLHDDAEVLPSARTFELLSKRLEHAVHFRAAAAFKFAEQPQHRLQLRQRNPGASDAQQV